MRSLFVVLASALAACTTVLAQGAIVRTHSISMPYIGKKKHFKKIHSNNTLTPPFIDDELQNRWFDFAGNTVINTNHQIRLTSTKQSQLGYLWSRLVKLVFFSFVYSMFSYSYIAYNR